MLIAFKSDAYADIIMFGDVAQQLLKMMGHSGAVPSAIQAEDVPAALERLKRSLEGEKKTSDRAEAGAEAGAAAATRGGKGSERKPEGPCAAADRIADSRGKKASRRDVG